MIFLICLAVLGTVLAVPLTPVVEEPSTRDLGAYVLPTETFPTFYDIRLFFDPSNEASFSGDVSIRIASFIETNRIVLHAMELAVDNIEVYPELDQTTNLYQNHSLATDDTHLLTIDTSEALQPLRPYTLKINFVGQYAANMFGVYVSKYEENNVTQ